MRILATIALVTLAACLQPAEAAPSVALKFATTAPRSFPVGRELRAWGEDLRKRTNGRLKQVIYAGGSHGEERDYVAKMRAAQLDGAHLSGTGLGLINRSLLVLRAPAVMDDYRRLDQVCEAMQGTFDQLFEQSGFTRLAWAHPGVARVFSTVAIKTPGSMRARQIRSPSDDDGTHQLLSAAGVRSPVRLGRDQVLGALSAGRVDTLIASALDASSNQWHGRMQYVGGWGLWHQAGPW